MDVGKWGWYSVAVNVTLAALNWMVAAASGSLAVAAEMVHNAVDVVSALAVLAGLKLAKRKSKAFPYGLYKVENMVALAVSLLTLLTAYEIGREALMRSAAPATINPWVVGGAMVSAVLPLDRLVALFVVILIGRSAFELLLDSVRVLLDASLPAETVAEIRETIAREPLVAAVKYVTGRNAGRYRFVEAEIVLRTENLAKSHGLQTRVEDQIRQTLPNVERVLIHTEPMARTHLCYTVPLADLIGTLSEHFGEAPYFVLATVRLAGKQIERQEIVANPHTEVPKAKGIRVAEWLVEQKVDRLLMREDLQGKGPLYVFREAGVELLRTQAQTLAEAIRESILARST